MNRQWILSITALAGLVSACVPSEKTAAISSRLIAGTTVFINEIHYDNSGVDAGEAIEIAGPAGMDLAGWSLVLYNGSNGSVYNTTPLSGVIADQQSGLGTLAFPYPTNGIQNGGPDGIALIDSAGVVVQFLSYEGTFTAVGGPGDGLTSTDIGVFESSATQVGQSLQLSGTGAVAEDFTWTAAAPSTFDAVNNEQSFAGGGTAGGLFVNEIHYDNAGADQGEAVEIAGPAGTDVSGWQLVLYNGNGGGVYGVESLSGIIPDQQDGFGTLAFAISGLQNGAPDGIALVNPSDDVVEFVSYEGSFTATGGPANGLTSTDIGVSEASNTSVGQSLQRTGSGTSADDFAWSGPAQASFGDINNNQTFGDGGDGGGGGGDPELCGSPFTPIYALQGSGATSTLQGEEVSLEGIVTGDFQGDDSLRGFFVQDAAGDGNPATSDGIMVFDGSLSLVDVAAGDAVRVRGTVVEFFGQTEITNVSSVLVCGSGSVTPTPVALPAANGVLNSDGELIPDLEAFEGMLVQFVDPLTVTEIYNLGRFGQISLSQGGRLFTPTNVADPGDPAADLQDDNNLRRIILDDGASGQNLVPVAYPPPALAADNIVRGGDTVADLTGVLAFSRGSGGSGEETYRLHPTVSPVFETGTPRTEAPADVSGSFRVASFNVLNYFTTVDNGSNNARGADSEAEFARQRAKIISAILAIDADVLGLVELENNGYGPESAISDLVDGLNEAAAGTASYTFLDPEVSQIGSDAIAVGLIYRPDYVEPIGSAAILDSTVDPRFLDTKNRPALAQTFVDRASGGIFTVAVNHFKSKGSSCDDVGDPNTGDGQGNCNQTRTDAAAALVDWLATDPTGSNDNDVLIIGDLNAYAKEDPIDAIKAANYTDLVAAFGGEEAYSYVFAGQFGYLDHALATSSLTAQVTGTTVWHINSEEMPLLDYNDTVQDTGEPSFESLRPEGLFTPDPYRSSDHDPVIIGISLTADSLILLDLLIEEVKALHSSGVLAFGQAFLLKAQLRLAKRFLEREQLFWAKLHLESFLATVDFLAFKEVLTIAQAGALVNPATIVMNSSCGL